MNAKKTTTQPAPLNAPFPYFGGKRKIAELVWERLGSPKHYIEPFCGSAAMLLLAPQTASLEVINDANGFIANFWRCVVHQPREVAWWADYPVSHIDMGARHPWLMDQRERLGASLQDPNWPGDAKVAGWWLWGQCSWIGSGWCNWFGTPTKSKKSNGGRGIQAVGKIPHVGNGGRGIQAVGQIPHVGNGGRGIQAVGQIPHVGDGGRVLTSGGAAAHQWLSRLCERMGRVRVVHGDWHRCLNNHYGKKNTAVFIDPPYKGSVAVYGQKEGDVHSVESWCESHGDLKIALCGHEGEYNLPGWDVVPWTRSKSTYGGKKTTNLERLWFSPGCEVAK